MGGSTSARHHPMDRGHRADHVLPLMTRREATTTTCGGGSYHVIDQFDLRSATAYLLYNGTTNCVVTWKKTTGTASYLSAVIRASSGAAFTRDEGQFKIYAGPVKVNAAGKCIQWGGQSPEIYFISEWVHCG
ncbi:hypothetical protein FHR32_008130 [Streptosporangium album]|uniref:Uncharacterized protein n=1 Tax=Streptosporangium album TaxID=47479 RepID=A0A7W7S4G2_9ACTN|nr:hypothetical protein [Streptosporangium album]MBB4943729.1 hypothetical protein [Streptosporangium album]